MKTSKSRSPSTKDKEKDRKSQQNKPQNTTEFIYPLGFLDFTRIRQIEKSKYTVKDYHHLLKLKKMLENTEKKMSNRINLFKKASQKIVKKRHQQSILAQKIINVKNIKIQRNLDIQRSIEEKENYINQDYHENQQQQGMSETTFYKNSKWTRAGTPSIRNIPQSAKTLNEGRSFLISNKIVKHNTNTSNNTQYLNLYKQKSQSPDIHQIQSKIIEIKFNNAKNMKQQRQRYKMIIEERRKQQISRNLQSAQHIRKTRENAKMIKIEIEKKRRDQINKTIEQKIKRQKEHFFQLQKNLDYLQNQERQALIAWKKTLDA